METTYKANRNKGMGRFAMVARKLLIEQKRTLMIMAGSYLGACALFGLWFGYLRATPRAETMIVYILISGLACGLVASKMFFDMTSKEGRTALLMTPATASDKYLTRFIGVLPGMILLVVLGYLAYGYADLLSLGLKYDMWMPLPNPFKGAAENPNTISTICAVTAMFLFNESIFMYGAVAWPKKSFLKSLGVFAAIQIVLFFAAAGLGKFLMEFQWRIVVENGEALSWSIIGCITAVAALIMWLSFRKFKNSTVI